MTGSRFFPPEGGDHFFQVGPEEINHGQQGIVVWDKIEIEGGPDKI
jgi:hypothetical protein